MLYFFKIKIFSKALLVPVFLVIAMQRFDLKKKQYHSYNYFLLWF